MYINKFLRMYAKILYRVIITDILRKVTADRETFDASVEELFEVLQHAKLNKQVSALYLVTINVLICVMSLFIVSFIPKVARLK